MHFLSVSILSLFILQGTVDIINGFYVPGVAPLDFNEGDPVEVKVSGSFCFSLWPFFILFQTGLSVCACDNGSYEQIYIR